MFTTLLFALLFSCGDKDTAVDLLEREPEPKEEETRELTEEQLAFYDCQATAYLLGLNPEQCSENPTGIPELTQELIEEIEACDGTQTDPNSICVMLELWDCGPLIECIMAKNSSNGDGGTVPPTSPGEGCEEYGDSTMGGVSNKCMCEQTPNDEISNAYRTCLQLALHPPACTDDMELAHVCCLVPAYQAAGGLPGWIEELKIGLSVAQCVGLG